MRGDEGKPQHACIACGKHAVRKHAHVCGAGRGGGHWVEEVGALCLRGSRACSEGAGPGGHMHARNARGLIFLTMLQKALSR